MFRRIIRPISRAPKKEVTGIPEAPPSIKTEADLARNLTSFRRAVAPPFKSQNTSKTYVESVRQFAEFLATKGMPQQVASIRREHVETFIQHLGGTRKPATTSNRYRGLQAFFKFLAEEGEIKESPMKNMKPPRVPMPIVPVLTEDQLKALFDACRGDSFTDRRDAALIRTYATTGARRTELLDLRISESSPEENDVDLDMGHARVRGKGGRERLIPLDPKTVRLLDRYIRVRERHEDARLPYLWLGRRGRLTAHGVRHIIDTRGLQAGIPDLHPHMLRHSFAHHWLADGGQETDLQRIAGWRSPEMLRRYAASAAQDRALSAAKRFGIGNRI